MRIEVWNRREITNHNGTEIGESVAIISIAYPRDDHPAITEWPGLEEVLRLSFHDIDEQFKDIGKEIPSKYESMTDENGREVANFVEKHKDVDLLIVQCDAGISRSSGMAAAILKHQTGNDSRIFDNPRFVPNRRVYRKTLQALMN